MHKSVRHLAVAVSLLATLLVPATGAFAAPQSGPQGQSQHGGAGRPAQGPRDRRGGHHPHQVEGVIVSLAPDDTRLTVRPPETTALSTTILIASSTVITADAGVTTTVLAVGEQVHVLARHEGNALVALRIDIQRLPRGAGCSRAPETGNGAENGPPKPGAGQGDATTGDQRGGNQVPGCAAGPQRGNGGGPGHGPGNDRGPGTGGQNGTGGQGSGCGQDGSSGPGQGGNGRGAATSPGDEGNPTGPTGDCGPGNGSQNGPGGNGAPGTGDTGNSGPGNGQGGSGNGGPGSTGGPGPGQGGDRTGA